MGQSCVCNGHMCLRVREPLSVFVSENVMYFGKMTYWQQTYLHHTINTNSVLWPFNWIIFCAISASIHIAHTLQLQSFREWYLCNAPTIFHWTLAFEHIEHSQSNTNSFLKLIRIRWLEHPKLLWHNQVASLEFEISDWYKTIKSSIW